MSNPNDIISHVISWLLELGISAPLLLINCTTSFFLFTLKCESSILRMLQQTGVVETPPTSCLLVRGGRVERRGVPKGTLLRYCTVGLHMT